MLSRNCARTHFQTQKQKPETKKREMKLPIYISEILDKLKKLETPKYGNVFLRSHGKQKDHVKIEVIDDTAGKRKNEVVEGCIKKNIQLIYEDGNCVQII